MICAHCRQPIEPVDGPGKKYSHRHTESKRILCFGSYESEIATPTEDTTMNEPEAEAPEEFARVIYVDLQYHQKPDDWEGVRWQPWSAIIKSAGNMEPLFRSTERWTNRQDAIDTITLAHSAATTVFLREAEHGNVLLRQGVVEQ